MSCHEDKYLYSLFIIIQASSYETFRRAHRDHSREPGHVWRTVSSKREWHLCEPRHLCGSAIDGSRHLGCRASARLSFVRAYVIYASEVIYAEHECAGAKSTERPQLGCAEADASHTLQISVGAGTWRRNVIYAETSSMPRGIPDARERTAVTYVSARHLCERCHLCGRPWEYGCEPQFANNVSATRWHTRRHLCVVGRGCGTQGWVLDHKTVEACLVDTGDHRLFGDLFQRFVPGALFHDPVAHRAGEQCSDFLSLQGNELVGRVRACRVAGKSRARGSGDRIPAAQDSGSFAKRCSAG